MSHVLQKIPLCSQWFSLNDGYSTRHARDINLMCGTDHLKALARVARLLRDPAIAHKLRA